MKISELKQPYRRMAEYLVSINQNELFDNKNLLMHGFTWSNTDTHFWTEVDNGNHPPITEEIKQHFPTDFDFSEEGAERKEESIILSEQELFNLILGTHIELSNMSATGMVSKSEVILSKIDEVIKLNKGGQLEIADPDFSDNEVESKVERSICLYCGINPLVEICKHPKSCSTKRKVKQIEEVKEEEAKEVEIPFSFQIFNSMIKKEVKEAFNSDANAYYTQLVKEGRFDKLPDTCEFSEPIELNVWNEGSITIIKPVFGKFKGFFISESVLVREPFSSWENAQLPTLDFSEFKTGDAVIVELLNEEKRIGWFDYFNHQHLVIRMLIRKGDQVTNGGSCAGSKMINLQNIKSINKIVEAN